ncbi:MAG: fused MFS/spermidine synthase [Pseudomonadota bacterium]
MMGRGRDRPPGASALDPVLALFAATLFTGALLLFWVQPMFSKMVLPILGGTPQVWNICLVFFQAALLAGYLYAHASVRWLGVRRQAALHLALLAAAGLSTLPIALPAGAGPDPLADPSPWLLTVLAASVGAPFAVAAATAPMMQAWFATTGHAGARDPYFLYAASNLGSMLALVGYPALLEPQFALPAQSVLWAGGFALLVALTGACALAAGRGSVAAAAPDVVAEGTAAGGPAKWILLSFAPSSLLMGVTTHITTDIASAPLLWVMPLILYLGSFVLVFSRRRLLPHAFMVGLQPILIVPIAALALWQIAGGRTPILALHLLAFFATAMVCHGELAASRPPARRLTEFYLYLSVGGVMGGLFNALLAPLVFEAVVEYPLALILASFLRPPMAAGRDDAPRRKLYDVLAPFALLAALLAAVLGFREVFSSASYGAKLILAGGAALAALPMALRPLRFGLAVAGIFMAGALAPSPDGDILYRERNFFGVLRVSHNQELGAYILKHDTTIHGAQRRDEAARLEPQTYYHPSGPIGDVFQALDRAIAGRPVAAIGLGAGSIACYGRPGQSWTFYELNPAAERIARDPRFFTFLRDCPPAVEVVLGDARRMLAAAPAAAYAALVLDAFSSDAIPLHLLTREAMQLYLDKLAPGGVIAIHVSNRHLELRPVFGNIARDLGLYGITRNDPAAGSGPVVYSSTWVALARRAADLGPLVGAEGWTALPVRPQAGVWTDGFSNLVSAAWWKLRD